MSTDRRSHDTTDGTTDGARTGPGHGSGGAGPGDGGRGGAPGGGDDIEALLRQRLRLADEQIETPPGLWARISEPEPGRASPVAAVVRRRRPFAAALAVAATVAAVALGMWWLVRPDGGVPGPAATGEGVPITVFNGEAACRASRALECGLRLAEDPHRRYAARDNAAGRVWHGDPLSAHCVVTDGRMVRDEQGITSTRWYLVTTQEGIRGWLPGVRTRNTREVPVCSTDDL